MVVVFSGLWYSRNMRIRQKWKKWVLFLFLWNLLWAAAINVTSKAVVEKQYALGIKERRVPQKPLTQEEYDAILRQIEYNKAHQQ